MRHEFGELIEFKMWNIFLKNYTQNVVEKLFLDPFLKNRNRAYLWINSLKFYTVFFFIVCQAEGYLKALKLRCRPHAFTTLKAFCENKKKCGNNLPASFYVWILKKNILLTDKALFFCQIPLSLLTSLWRQKFWN